MGRGGKGENRQTFCCPQSEPFWWNPPPTGQLRASGDGSSSSAPAPCCRICAGERGLKRITDRCPWEGGRDTYDQIISYTFRVNVPVNCLICDRCVAQLRNSQKFRAMVYAAFSKDWSDCTSLHTTDLTTASNSIRTLKNPSQTVSKISDLPHPISEIIESTNDTTTANKKILEMLSKKVVVSNSKKDRRKRSSTTSNISTVKRIIVACNACGQRYPMIATENMATHEFICSRCKLKWQKDNKGSGCRKCHAAVQSTLKEHTADHCKGDAKKYRQRISSSITQKTPHVYVSETMTLRPNNTVFRCPICAKKYSQSKLLAEHVKRNHGEGFKCGVCKREFRNKSLLDQHLQVHSGEALYECDICKRVIKGKNALRLHYLTHDNFRLSK